MCFVTGRLQPSGEFKFFAYAFGVSIHFYVINENVVYFYYTEHGVFSGQCAWCGCVALLQSMLRSYPVVVIHVRVDPVEMKAYVFTDTKRSI